MNFHPNYAPEENDEGDGQIEAKTSWNGPVLGRIPVDCTNVWKEYSVDLDIPDGIQALYFTYVGEGGANLTSVVLE
ncbi:carbohydrate-binding protein [Cohnella cholangitidis]|uniref:hypothetical protein n=1 Tax=Cohnella cholangitidis TaxID=2598458 RepID=UPI001C717B4A|nr:hypothetical protein [Cohnella cholangitidis]